MAIFKMIELITSGNWDALINDVVLRIAIILGCWGMMVASVFIDLWSGVDAARSCGEKIVSNGLRRTVSKLGDYFRVELFFLMFDGLGSLISWYELPYASMVGALAIILIEGKSVIENSRKKKSSAADLPDMIRKIIATNNAEQAKNLIGELNNSSHETNQ